MTGTRIEGKTDDGDWPTTGSARRRSGRKDVSQFRRLLPWVDAADAPGEERAPAPDHSPAALAERPRLGGSTAQPARPAPQPLHDDPDEADLADEGAGTPTVGSATGPHAVKPVRRALFRDDASRRDAMAGLTRLICLLHARRPGQVQDLTIVPPAPNPLRLRLTLQVDEAGMSVLARTDLDASRRPEVQQVLHVLQTMLCERLAPLPVHVTLLS
jgi:hypothetical protein